MSLYPNQPPTGEPLVIRAHHIGNHLQYHSFNYFLDPEQMSWFRRDYMGTVVERSRMATETLRDAASGIAVPAAEMDDALYVKDAFGLTRLEAQAHALNVTKVLHSFEIAPPETPVEIAPKKDRICRETCAIGNHCNVIDVPREKAHLDDFAGMAQRAEVPLNVGELSITGTLGQVKDVLDHHIRHSGKITFKGELPK